MNKIMSVNKCLDGLINNNPYLIAPYMKQNPDILCRVLHQLPHSEKRAELLYQILIAPFAAICAADRIDDYEEDENNDAYDY